MALATWQNDTMRPIPNHRQNTTAGASSAALSGLLHPALWRPSVSRLVAALAGAALVAALSGCMSATPSNSGPASAEPATATTPTPGTGPATPETPAEPLADTSSRQPTAGPEAAATESVKKTVTDALGRLAAGSPKPATAQVAEALAGAGIAPAALQVSQSRTPTGLEADAIEAAVLEGNDCVIGQVRDGTVTVTVLPVLASGKCFVGS
jgi:hypothetical protein